MQVKKMIDATTFVYGIIGNPVAHSLSPVMHNRAFESIGFNGVYTAFKVDDPDVEAAVSGIRALGIKGVSVTIPHKISVMNFLDEVEDSARRIGAVNTIVNRDGRLKGCNTDGMGAVRALKEKTTLKGRAVMLVGAGGAARSIGFAVQDEGARVVVVNRTAARGKKLATDLNADFFPLSGSDLPKCDILINTTSVGMTPDSSQLPVPTHYLEKGMVVMDIVYHPLKTRLLMEAKRAGCVTVDGLSMLIYQGALQFELWTERQAPVNVMREAALNVLNRER